MSGKKRIVAVALVLLLLIAGGVTCTLLFLGNDTPKIEETPAEDVGTDAPSLQEEHWNAENQIEEVGTMYPVKTNFDGDRSDDEGMVPIEEFDIPTPTNPEPDPREASVLKGEVQYDDIPTASTIDGDYSADDIKAEMIKYLADAYPTEVIAEISLIGNGSATSQNTGVDTSYVNYLVTFQKGKRVGISVTSSSEDVPYVTETNYLVVNKNLLYKVEENEYVQMDSPAVERIPADTVIDH